MISFNLISFRQSFLSAYFVLASIEVKLKKSSTSLELTKEGMDK